MANANLTLTIDQDVLRRARMRALHEGTSVNAVVRENLERYAGDDPMLRAMAEYLVLTEHLDAGSGTGGRSWRREDLYDRDVMRERP